MGPRREYALRQNKWESVCFALKRLGDCCMQDLLKPVEIGDETRLRTRAGGARDPNFSGAVVGTKAEGASSPAMPALIVEVPMSRTEASFTAIGKKSSQEGSLEIDRESTLGGAAPSHATLPRNSTCCRDHSLSSPRRRQCAAPGAG